MRIAVEGCAHGELEIIYNAIEEIEKSDGRKIDLLICCGDFQSTRNLADLKCMAVPDKYKEMCTFYKYYSGEKIAPVLTIFIGGNHEASNYLQELPYGGWVAPNIYYMGYASVVTVGGIRIAGVSGIYKGQHFLRGHYEKPPYDDHTIRSVYHIRNLEVFRLKQLSGKIDIFLSHDWPLGITKYGNEKSLLKVKPFFKSDIESNSLGSPPLMELLEQHYPCYWFSAHLHCKFAALVADEEKQRVTKFLALDKCLPKRKFLQVLEIANDENAEEPLKLSYDLEWLTILYLTNHLLSIKSNINYMPGENSTNTRWKFTPTSEEKAAVLKKFQDNLEIPQNFQRTVEAYDPSGSKAEKRAEKPQMFVNNQTTEFCDLLGIDDPSMLLQIIRTMKDSSIEDSILDSSFETTLDTTVESGHDLSSALEDDILETSTTEERTTGFTPPMRPNSMSKVKLPSPKNVVEGFDVDEIDTKRESLAKINLSASTSDSDSLNESVREVTAIEPNSKKFKRRNQSIYLNSDE